MIIKLLIYEFKLFKRNAEKKVNKLAKKFNFKNDSKNDFKFDNHFTCIYKPCGKKGYIEDIYFIKKRY